MFAASSTASGPSRPFRFAISFPDGVGMPTPGETSPSDLARQLAEARAQGHAAGLAEARSELTAALLTAVDALGAAAEALLADAEAGQARLADELAELALTAGEAMAAQAITAYPHGTVAGVMRRLIDTVARGTELSVTVNPALVAPLTEHIAGLQASDRRRLAIEVTGDAAVPPGDARIGWDNGGCTLDRAERRARVIAELDATQPDAG